MSEYFQEVEEAVDEIQSDIFESVEPFDDYDCFNIILSGNGYGLEVNFLGFQLWCSENDDRKEVDSFGNKEPLEQHLRCKMREMLSKLSHIKV